MAEFADLAKENTTNLGPLRDADSSAPAAAPGNDDVIAKNLALRYTNDCDDPDPTFDVTKISRDTSTSPEIVALDVMPMPSPREAQELPALVGKFIANPKADNFAIQSAQNTSLANVAGLAAGDVVADRYVVVDALPGSGMGQIYKALDKQRDSGDALSSYVALKFMRAAVRSDDDAESDIRREFDTLSRLPHPNIVKAYDTGLHNGVEFMVLEWLEGTSLLHLLEAQSSKRIALSRARYILRSVAAALACAHEKNIVHGDVKPSNIFVTNHGAVKLLDFGAIYEKRDGEVLQSWATRAYASVDVLSGSEATKADDVYSLGVTAYLLLSGERPFGTKDAIEARQENFPLRPLPSDSSDDWPAVCKALSFDASERPVDAARFLAEYLRLCPAGAPPAKPIQYTYPYYATAAALVVLLAAAWVLRIDGLAANDVRETLLRANTALVEGRLIEPEQDNAFELYSAVLATSPENTEAQRGLHEIADEYLVRASDSLGANDLQAARRNLRAARQVAPEHSSIPIVENLFDRFATDLVVTAEQIASSDPAKAESLLTRVEALTGDEAERIATLRSRIEQEALDTELSLLIAGIDDRILAERLAVPRGDSAIDLLRKAQQLKPDDERLPLAANRIVSALLFKALFAISEGKLDTAAGFIDSARSLNVRHLATAQTAYELAKARDRVAEEVFRRAMSVPAASDARVSGQN